jgi:bifunctional UDP-N-acetylglucosamine pyrophosphorylase/glucosamine-1-phosphate N-acetyltransferase
MNMEQPTEEHAPSPPPTLAAVILAAGMGKRMRSTLPKVLHRIAGVPLVGHVLRAIAPLTPTRTVLIVGHGGEQVQATIGPGPEYVFQAQQLGTAHAVLQARAAVEGQVDTVLVLYGDSPLLRSATLQELVSLHHARPETRVSMLTCVTPDPYGYGRIIRDAAGQVLDIVEEKVATPEQRAILEINSGIYCFDADWLWPRLAALPLHPGAGEYYLTDMIAVAIAEAPGSVQALALTGMEETAGINNRVQLAMADGLMRDRLREHWMLEGVTLIDPRSIYIDADVILGQDTILYPGCYLEGRTRVGAGCRLGPQAHLVDAMVGNDCVIGTSLLEGCTVEPGVDIGSFNHLRPGAYLATGVHLGNFAEVKNSRLGPHVAQGHFSYIGDADIGADTNIGAGTVTANFDRIAGRKHRTVVGVGADIGVDSLLVAPVEIGAGAKTGAGSVVTKDVPPGALVYGVPARVVRQLAPGPPSDNGPAPLTASAPEERNDAE